MVHHRERLAFVGEAGEHPCGVHAELHDFERHAPANGFTLLGERHRAHPAFAQGLDNAIAAEVVIQGRTWGRARHLGSELVATEAPECALNQTRRAEALGVAGGQFRSAPWTVWHFDSGILYRFALRL